MTEGAGLLHDRLAKDLPKGCCFIIHHLSTPPVPTPAIFAHPPRKHEEKTFLELHFLSVSIHHEKRPLQVFAIEIYIFTTERLTTLFVSKADSTGYLYLLNVPKGTPSPLRIICTTFLGFLVEERSRPDRPLVISLFARSQSQYLFPGSVENERKHVLDDRALIKWWCKVLHPLLEEKHWQSVGPQPTSDIKRRGSGFLRVPGCDTNEVRGFFPMEARGSDGEKRLWTVGDPLQELAPSPSLPERCLIPRFPDDPKARFLIDLDDELPSTEGDPESANGDSGPPQPPVSSTGRWKSVSSLDQFWEAMSFRQECAAGRLVGFVWAVFRPKDVPLAIDGSHTEDQKVYSQETPGHSDLLGQTDYYYWPSSSHGEMILQSEDYNGVGELLLKLDYGTVEDAIKSTETWTGSVSSKAGIQSWGRMVEGQNNSIVIQRDPIAVAPAPTMLNMNLIKKKKKRPLDDAAIDSKKSIPGADILQEDLSAKKAKIDNAKRPDLNKQSELP